ncbi:MAG: orotidine 5'-phosphate decarboxylase [Thermoproteus sp.]|jgi:orotidine-5'-phosphate decarboxylase|nr:orotidine 5'-phosphate decarboxylase [Thermoproteus sp.]
MYPVVVALDVDLRKALAVAESLRDEVAGFKVGWDLVLEAGLDSIKAVSRLGPVVVDLKLADIPYIVRRVVDKIAAAGACCAIAHGFLLPSLEKDERLYVLVKMTTGSRYDGLWRELLGQVAGFRGAVAPGNEPQVVSAARRALGCSARIISPGIGAQGGRPGDAIRAGADFEIVGRYVLEDPSRVSEWRGLKPACNNSI